MSLKNLWILSLGLLLGSGTASASSGSLDRLDRVNKTPMVNLEYLITDSIEQVGKIAASWSPANYLTNEDIIYLEMNIPVSVGDRFTIYKDHGRVRDMGGFSQSRGRRVQILGDLLVTEVRDVVVARISNANEDINRGNPITYEMSRQFPISPREPSQDVRGKVIAPAEPTNMTGSFNFAFLNKGSQDGLRLNDKLYIYTRGFAAKEADRARLPEVNIAELVVVSLTDRFATAYIMGGADSFEGGADFKTAVPQVRYLD